MGTIDELDRPIAFHRCFVQLTGSVNAALMLSQAYYWSKRSSTGDGWFYKVEREWEEETGLKRGEQQYARKLLCKMDFWEEDKRMTPRRLFFRVDSQKLRMKLADLLQQEKSESPHETSRLTASNKPTDGMKLDDLPHETSRLLNESEITAENTSEITQPEKAKSAFSGKRESKRNSKAARSAAPNHIWNGVPFFDPKLIGLCHPEQDVVAWMKDSARTFARKGWRLAGAPGGKGNRYQGPTSSMEEWIREHEREYLTNFLRISWLRFLESPASDNQRFPFRAFIDGWFDKDVEIYHCELDAKKRQAEPERPKKSFEEVLRITIEELKKDAGDYAARFQLKLLRKEAGENGYDIEARLAEEGLEV